MEKDRSQQPQPKVTFQGAFHLHPQDALSCLRSVHEHLQTFTKSFEERIETEFQYSKSLIRVSKNLSKHINPQSPSPLSYLSSAFQVEHEQRARHALELANYLHTEIEVPCQTLIQETAALLKQTEKQLRTFYKQGESTEETYQKHLKKYYRSRQEWEEKLMNKILSSQIPGIPAAQLQKLRIKLREQKQDNIAYEQKYLDALQAFNKFARGYNERITGTLERMQQICLKEVSLQSDSLRKLIVSEVNMFKNIQYDLLNISRQMQSLSPLQQFQYFEKEAGFVFASPIISIYADGPLVKNAIDLKFPMETTLLEDTLLKIDSGSFSWILQNKYNSTLRFCLKQAWNQFQGRQTQQFMQDLEDCIVHNKVVETIPLDKSEGLLNKEDVFSLAFSIVSNIGTFLRPIPLDQLKKAEIMQSLRNHFSTHHFYRFIAAAALEEFVDLQEDNKLQPTQSERLALLLFVLIEESLQGKDIFVLRSVITIMFSVGTETPLYLLGLLKELDFWNRNDFWEAVVFQGAFQQVSLLPSVSKSELKEIYLMRQKNVIFSALATYSHYMAMMGCEASQVHSLVSRYIHIYGLYDEHRKDLSRMVRNSIEKYKKISQEVIKSKDALNKVSEEDIPKDTEDSLKLCQQKTDVEGEVKFEQIQANLQAKVKQKQEEVKEISEGNEKTQK